jgi:AcrR family transcriptional regulator
MTTNVRPRRLTRDEAQARTREDLLNAARVLIAEKGLSGASVRDIAEAAGYTQGAFYSNFSRKEDILLELLRRHMADSLSELEALLNEARREPQRGWSLFKTWLEANPPDSDWTVVELELMLHASRNPDFAQGYDALYEGKRQALGRIIAGVFALVGKTPPGPPETIATGTIALSQGLAAMRRSGSAGASGEAMSVYFRALLGIEEA